MEGHSGIAHYRNKTTLSDNHKCTHKPDTGINIYFPHFIWFLLLHNKLTQRLCPFVISCLCRPEVQDGFIGFSCSGFHKTEIKVLTRMDCYMGIMRKYLLPSSFWLLTESTSLQL